MEKKNIYANGQIYAIRSHQTDLIYIGSTTQPLHKRWCQHKSDFKTREGFCNSSEIIKYGDAYIELIEDFSCKSKKELNKKEGEHIRSNNCVNKVSNLGKEQTEKIWRETHKEHIAKRMREYRAKNPEYFKQYDKQYQIDHKEHLNALSRKYYYDHKQS